MLQESKFCLAEIVPFIVAPLTIVSIATNPNIVELSCIAIARAIVYGIA